MKIGLVMEGGAMRGMYTAGVMDVLMENNICFDGAVGVSAGAVFGCNYKSHQIGRVIRYNKKYCRDKRYKSLRSLIRTGDLFGVSFCYHEIPDKLDIFDTETFRTSPMKFYVTCTDMKTGKPVYHRCETGSHEDIEWMRASASIPVVSRPVYINGGMYMDGGMSDSIPLRFLQDKGYEKIVLILTRHLGYTKKKNSMLPIIKLKYRAYPEFVEAIATRHIRYNETLDYIRAEEQKNDIFVIRPSIPIDISSTEDNPDELERIYRLGRSDAKECMSALTEYLQSILLV